MDLWFFIKIFEYSHNTSPFRSTLRNYFMPISYCIPLPHFGEIVKRCKDWYVVCIVDELNPTGIVCAAGCHPPTSTGKVLPLEYYHMNWFRWMHDTLSDSNESNTHILENNTKLNTNCLVYFNFVSHFSWPCASSKQGRGIQYDIGMK